MCGIIGFTEENLVAGDIAAVTDERGEVRERGCEIDQPRNLAKSVTVE